jgi:glycosyltransferase involved in cell wall biosynthesis
MRSGHPQAKAPGRPEGGMRIVYVTHELPFGDGEAFVIAEVQALLRAGHEVLVVPRRSHEPVIHDDVEDLLARARPMPNRLAVAVAAAGAIAREPRRAGRALWAVRVTRPRYRSILNAVATGEGMWLARVARAWRADHIHAHWAHWTATMAMGASAMTGIPWSFTAHRYDIVINNLLDLKLRSARFGRFIARYMLDMGRGLVGPEAAARAILLYMGVRIPPKVASRPPRAAPVIVCPGRLVPMKAQRYLVDAAAMLAARGVAFELWLAGDGPDAAALAGQVHALGLERSVRMLGVVPHAALLGLYRDGSVDCVALPSRDLGGGVHEGLSVALIEAMAYGIPAVSTPTGGQAELLDGAGRLVPPGDAAALADTLGALLASPGERERIGMMGRHRIEERFDVDVIAAELVRLFAGGRVGHLSAMAVGGH